MSILRNPLFTISLRPIYIYTTVTVNSFNLPHSLLTTERIANLLLIPCRPGRFIGLVALDFIRDGNRCPKQPVDTISWTRTVGTSSEHSCSTCTTGNPNISCDMKLRSYGIDSCHFKSNLNLGNWVDRGNRRVCLFVS